MTLQLKPSEIFYSQDTINNVFTSGSFKKGLIGKTLDDLVSGRIRVCHIPTITVTRKPGSNKWYTLDNRRLWVFHHLEAAGKCSTIAVATRDYKYLDANDRRKFSSNNGGCSIDVRRSPGGEWCRKIRPVRPKCDESYLETKEDIINPIEKIRKQMIDRLRRIQSGERLPVVPFHKWSRESQKWLDARAAQPVGGRIPLRSISTNTEEVRSANLEATLERQKVAREAVVEKNRHVLQQMCENINQAVDENIQIDDEDHIVVADLVRTADSETKVIMSVDTEVNVCEVHSVLTDSERTADSGTLDDMSVCVPRESNVQNQKNGTTETEDTASKCVQNQENGNTEGENTASKRVLHENSTHINEKGNGEVVLQSE